MYRLSPAMTDATIDGWAPADTPTRSVLLADHDESSQVADARYDIELQINESGSSEYSVEKFRNSSDAPNDVVRQRTWCGLASSQGPTAVT
jgi:hypothetical protein